MYVENLAHNNTVSQWIVFQPSISGYFVAVCPGSIPEEFGIWDESTFSGRDPGKSRETIPIGSSGMCAWDVCAGWMVVGCGRAVVMTIPSCTSIYVCLRTWGFIMWHPGSPGNWGGGMGWDRHPVPFPAFFVPVIPFGTHLYYSRRSLCLEIFIRKIHERSRINADQQ